MNLPSDERLWVLGTVLYVGGDTLTTAIGLGAGFEEDNPVSAALIGQGWETFIVTKVGAVVVAYIAYAYLKSEGASYASLIPLMMILLGGLATLTNGGALAANEMSGGAIADNS